MRTSECATLIQLRQTNCKSLGKCETQSRVIYCLCYLLFFLLPSPSPPAVCLPPLPSPSLFPLNYLTDLICLGCSLFTIVSEPRIYVYCGLQLLRVSAASVCVAMDVCIDVSVSQAVAVSLATSLGRLMSCAGNANLRRDLKGYFILLCLLYPPKWPKMGRVSNKFGKRISHSN